MRNTELYSDLPVLYELALNTNLFDDIHQNARHFIQSLIERKRFRRVALYLEPALAGQTGHKNDALVKFISLPFSNEMPDEIKKCDFPEHELTKQFVVRQQCMVHENGISSELCLIFKLQKLGMLIIFTGDKNQEGLEVMASQLSTVIGKFAESLHFVILHKELERVKKQLENQNQILKNLLAENSNKLEKNRHRLELSTIASGIAPWDWNIKTGEVNFDELWANMLGYSLEELKPVTFQTWINLCHPDDLVYSNSVLDEHIKGNKKHYRCEVRMKHKSGRWKWILDQGKVYQWDDDGHPLLITGTHQDITPIKEAMAALQESEAKYKALVESSSHFIAIVAEGEIKFANRPLALKTGLLNDQLLGKPFINLFAEEDEDTIRKYCLRMTDPSFQNTGLTATLADINANPVEVSISHSHFIYNEKPARMIIMEDITGRKFLEQQLKQSQKLEALGALSGGIAHDFNNILQVIRLQVELLKIDLHPNDVAEEYLKKMDSAIEHGGQITTTLLDYHKKEKTSELMAIDVSALLNNFIQVLNSLLPSTIIIKQLIEDNCHIHASKNRLEQMLLNLAMNAKDAMNNKGILGITMQKSMGRDKNGLVTKIIRTEISDNGIGMDKDVIDRLFEPYFTTKTVGKGTGLGLHTVFSIVNEFDGTISVKSKPGKGATFTIDFPESGAL